MSLEGLGLAEDLVRQAVARGAGHAEVYVERRGSLDVEVERGRLSGSGMDLAAGGAVRTLQDGRLGFAYFTDPTNATIAIERALDQARLAPEEPFTLPQGKTPTSPARWDERLASLDPDLPVSWCRDLIAAATEACPDAVIGGGASIGWHTMALANSAGVTIEDRSTMASAYASLVVTDGVARNAWDTTTRWDASIDAAALGAGVAHTVQELGDPRPAATGRADVVLRPNAGSELVLGLIEGAMDGDTAMRGKSFWSGKEGERVGHEGLHVIDDPMHPEALFPTACDDEGAVAKAHSLISGGVLGGFLFDARDAARHDRQATGHAVRDGFKAPPSTGAHHVVMTHDQTLAEKRLLADIDEGYLVESVLGAHTANGTTGDFSVTAANVWRIRGGEVVGASQEVAIGGNLPELLGRLDAVGADPKRTSGAIVPSMRLRDVQVSA